jgi:hypothetical protein
MKMSEYYLGNYEVTESEYWKLNRFSMYPEFPTDTSLVLLLKQIDEKTIAPFKQKYGDLNEYFRSNPVVHESLINPTSSFSDVKDIVDKLLKTFD